MPEGHTIHRHARNHQQWLAGQTVTVSSPQGRFESGASAITGRRFLRADAWGKHLFHVYEGDVEEPRFVHIHLGLFGRFKKYKEIDRPVRGAIRQRIVSNDLTLDLHGPTCCEVLTEEQVRAKTARLGPDPLRKECSADGFIAKLKRRRRGIGAVLLDQSVIAGIGNVYRAELLLAHRLHPERPANELSEDEVRALWDTTAQWLTLGVKMNRIITTTPDEVGRPYSRMRTFERVRIYKRPTCGVCGGPVATCQSANRTLYWCPSCQA